MTDARPDVRLLLVGLMGSGKSSVGRALSGITGWPYIDNDVALEAREGKPVDVVGAELGPDALHALEVRVLIDTMRHDAPFIAGAAASVVTSGVARTILREHAYVVWLRASIETLIERVGDGSGRPWLQPDPVAAIRRLADGRDPLYAEVADLVVDVDNTTVEQVADVVLSSLPTPVQH
jgi:shikimate kinase